MQMSKNFILKKQKKNYKKLKINDLNKLNLNYEN